MTAFKSILSELRLYVCNHIAANIPSHTVRLAFYRQIMGFELAEGVAIHLGARFDCTRGLKINENSVINENCRLDCRGGLTIGRNVSISAETIILTADHDPNTDDFRGRLRPVIIEDYVFIGTRATVLPGVTLHRGAVVAAGAVVTRSVEALNIVGGTPARSLGTRNPKLSYKSKHSRFLH
jgi:acetyltransferase-like isoleucine patch superfamily enzyme